MKPVRWLYVTPNPAAPGAVDAVRAVWLVYRQWFSLFHMEFERKGELEILRSGGFRLKEASIEI